MQDYLTVSASSSGEIVIDRSRFIAVLAHISSEEEAMEFVAQKRKEHYNARHTVYAYRLSDSTSRFSDDGEPRSTAGKPVMDVITGAGLYDVVLVVTRYFGGILLGTGGLVRAYSTSAAAAVENADIVKMTECAHMHISCPYPAFESLKKFLCDFGCEIKDTKYTDEVLLEFLVKNSEVDAICSKITDKFAGRMQPQVDFVEFTAFSK